MRLSINRDKLLSTGISIVTYSDADFVADRLDKKSVTEGGIIADRMPVFWFTKEQVGVSLSTTMKAEFTAASVVVARIPGRGELVHYIGLECKKPKPQAKLSKLTIDTVSSSLRYHANEFP
uniref:AlNc14C558G12149 protein n=1 Tax=Albugo laibachii Nc14 TaxID=890382 RepID=F0X156_9STRA|nr:AlNc14C558G12149 [Albugo laibachii Nc14]|eukprot:CCA27512.1 AlNc14C558G12149 [Albugo laibachii Nc14]